MRRYRAAEKRARRRGWEWRRERAAKFGCDSCRSFQIAAGKDGGGGEQQQGGVEHGVKGVLPNQSVRDGFFVGSGGDDIKIMKIREDVINAFSNGLDCGIGGEQADVTNVRSENAGDINSQSVES